MAYQEVRINADGAINVGDTAIVRSRSGDFLP